MQNTKPGTNLFYGYIPSEYIMALKYIFGNKLWNFCTVAIGSQYGCKIGYKI